MQENEASRTRIVGALVVRLDIEAWNRLKDEAENLGAVIIFQKIAPPGTKLWIERREPQGAP